MNKVTSSAPGKLMIVGEHAVVHGKPCIVTAVNQRLGATLELLDKPVLEVEAPEVDIHDYSRPLTEIGQGEMPKGTRFIEVVVKLFLQAYPQQQGLRVTTQSQFQSTFGFGSSSATVAALVVGLAKIYEVSLSEKELFDLGFKAILEIQGVGSGFDLAAAIYGGALYFVTPGKTIEPVETSFQLVVGYTGVKADTSTLVRMVNDKLAHNPEEINAIFEDIGKLVEEFRQALSAGDFATMGRLMNTNQEYLEKLGVSSPLLDSLIQAARQAGALGAKLSGAGGGDCMIALVESDKTAAVKEAISKAGGQIMEVEIGAHGAKIQ